MHLTPLFTIISFHNVYFTHKCLLCFCTYLLCIFFFHLIFSSLFVGIFKMIVYGLIKSSMTWRFQNFNKFLWYPYIFFSFTKNILYYPNIYKYIHKFKISSASSKHSKKMFGVVLIAITCRFEVIGMTSFKGSWRIYPFWFFTCWAGGILTTVNGLISVGAEGLRASVDINRRLNFAR